MACFITSKVVKGDESGKLELIIKDAFNGVSRKEDILIASINNNLADFLKAANEILEQRNSSVRLSSIEDVIKLLNEKGNGFTVNMFKYIVKQYYNKTHPEPNPSNKTVAYIDLCGFNSLTASDLSANYCATILNNIYWADKHHNYKGMNSDNYVKRLINRLKRSVKRDFIISFETLLDSKVILSENKNSVYHKQENYIKQLKSQYEEYKSIMNKINSAKEKLKNTTNEEEKEELTNLINRLDAENPYVNFYYNAIIGTVVNTYGTAVDKNLFNLVQQLDCFNVGDFDEATFKDTHFVDTTTFFNKVRNNPRCLKVFDGDRKTYDELVEKENTTDDSEFDDEDSEESEYEMYRNWDDKDYRTFTDMLDEDIKTYFNSLFHMSVPYKEQNSDIFYMYYDKNNEAGVPVPYNAAFVQSQIIDKGDFTSLENFINSIEKMANEVPELYGLGRLVYQMRNNSNFARHIFTYHDYKIFKKCMVIINSNGTLSSGISNKAANGASQLIEDLFNNIRTNYLNIKERYEISKMLDTLKANHNKIDSIIKTDKQLLDNDAKLLNNYLEPLNEAMKDLIPSIDFRVIRHFVYKADEKGNVNIKDNLLKLYEYITNIHKECSKELNKINNINNATKRNFSFYELLNLDDNSDLKKNIIDLCKDLSPYCASKYELNSKNAESNLSSDLIKNSYISRIFDQLKNGGINQILEKFKQCPQYQNSILYTGIHENGIDIPGLFKNVDGEWVVDEKGLERFDKYYFNGIKTADDTKSIMYSEMSDGDYFITMLQSYFNPIENSDDKFDVKVATINAFIQTPSDAPKNFLFRLPRIPYKRSINDKGLIYSKTESFAKFKNKYIAENNLDPQKVNDKEIFMQGLNRQEIEVDVNERSPMFVAFRQTLLNELQSYINQFNQVFKYNSTTGRYEVPTFKYNKKENRWMLMLNGEEIENNLIEGVHLKRKDDDLHTPYIVKDDKLAGNWFNFTRLFDVTLNGKSLFNSNEQMNNILHLYGEDGIIKKDKETGAIYIDESAIYNIGDEENNIESQLLTKDKNGNLSYSNVLENNVLNDVVKNFVNAYYKQASVKIFEYLAINDSLEHKFEPNQMFEALFGNILAEYELSDLLLGDTKFYKGALTELKRAKEVQAGGTSYVAYDYTKSLTDGIHVLDNKDIVVNGKTFEVYDRYNKVKSNMKLTDGFRAITVHNIRRSSKQVALMHQELVDIFIKQLNKNNKLNKEDINKRAVEMADKIVAGYKDTTAVDDAQSYITFEEFIRRRVIDGTIDRYTDIIQQIFDVRDGKAFPEYLDLDAINAKIQVQKNFYYDVQFDSKTGLDCPRQIKNAEFVLIPELLKGTELEKLYNLMIEKGIDQVNTEETSKVTQRNVLTLFTEDKDGSIKLSETIKDQLDDDRNVEEYKYMYLYKQQDIVSHLKEKENKVGIQAIKKIADNCNEETKPYVEALFKNYCANIKSSFTRLIRGLGWTVNEDGSLSNINSNYENLDFTEFYKKARYEAKRLGKDDQFIEFLTQDELGNPLMPNWMNNVSDKIMSIAQSIFNKSITRQTLPGWHAVQVTSVGHPVYDENGNKHSLKYHPAVYTKDGKTISEEQYNLLADKSGYTLKQEAYAEILVPKWWKNKTLFNKNITIEELAEAGLDLQIGYRIPTEGKQSISIFKVVGFLSDVYDSTVMVPDEWVTQTGSDMDVDTVYDIYFEPKIDKETGKISKIKSIDFDKATDEVKKQGYIDYIKDNLDRKIDDNFSDDINYNKKLQKESEDINVIGDIQSVERLQRLQKELIDFINNLPQELKSAIVPIYKSARSDASVDGRFNVADSINLFNRYLKINAKKWGNISSEYKVAVGKIFNMNDLILMAYQINNNERKQKSLEEYFKATNTYAKEHNLYSYEEWLKLSNVEKQVQAARNTEILESMIKIMENENSREENYSRSNFEKLSDSKKKYDDLRGANDNARSAYNPLDQIDFMKEARSGATLKAFSVKRDTFCSLNNYMHGELSDEHRFKVRYSLPKYNRGIISEAYDIDDDGVVVHSKIGWSKNNRNIEGYLITPYTSQTTAHILDVMKTGSIFNENKFTFGTFKTLIDCGVNYDTAVAFLMQPGITEICKAYSENASIYINTSNNSIDTAIRRIANKIGITIKNNNKSEAITDYTPMVDVYKVIGLFFNNPENAKTLNKVFNVKGSQSLVDYSKEIKIQNTRFILDEAQLADRISHKEHTIEDLIYDLGIVLEFRHLYNTTKNIEALVNISNPDKFGAKQTLKDTKQILVNIRKYRENSTDERGKQIGETIKIQDEKSEKSKNFVDALYPLSDKQYSDEFENIDIDKSSYPYMASFLNFSTITSVKVNEELFPLDQMLLDENHIDIMRKLIGRNIDDKTYKDLKKYYVCTIYNMNQYLTKATTICLEPGSYGQLMIDEERQSRYEDEEVANNDLIKLEKARILGRNEIMAYDFTPKSIGTNDPDLLKEDIDTFNKLSPVQKVLWIKNYCKHGNAGIFEYLDVSTFIDKNGKQKAIITFRDQIDNVNQLFNDFNNAFNCRTGGFENLMFRLAAIDLIKYAFISEGFNFKQRAISKIITNASIKNNIGDFGMGLIDGEVGAFNYYFRNMLAFGSDDFYEKFIRANSHLTNIINWTRFNKAGRMPKNNQLEGGAYIFNSRDTKVINFLMSQCNVTDVDNLPTYIRIKTKVNVGDQNDIYDKTTINKLKLYKIIVNKTEENTSVILVPKPLLDKTETDDVSSNPNPDYTTNVNPSVYEELINSLAIDNNIIESENINKEIVSKELKKSWDIKKVKSIKNSPEHLYTLLNWFNSGNEYKKGPAGVIQTKINNLFSDPEIKNSGYIVYSDKQILNELYGDILVDINDERKKVKLSYVVLSDKLRSIINDISLGIESTAYKKLNIAEKKLVNEIAKSKTIAIPVKVTIKENKQETNNDNISYSTTEDVTYDEINQTHNPNSIEEKEASLKVNPIINTASILGKSLYRAANSGDTFAEAFKRLVDTHRIDLTNKASLRANQNLLYRTIASAFKSQSLNILHELNHIKIDVSDDVDTERFEEFSIKDKNLYKYLVNPNNYQKVINLLLKAKMFGRDVKGVFAYIKSDDPEIQQSIEIIKSSIHNVLSSDEVKQGIVNIFEEHFAKNISTNPVIQKGVEYLRTSFNDSDIADKLFSDLGEIDNKQVQTVLKYVYSVMNAATQLTAPKVKKQFIKEYEEIMKSGADTSKVFDDKTGKLLEAFNEEFIKDKKQLRIDEESARREMNEAYRNFYAGDITEEQYNEVAKKYFRKHHERKKWLMTYTHQEVKDEYYKEDYDNEEKMMNSCFDLYVKYRRLRDRLKEFIGKEGALSEDELNEIKNIKLDIFYLTAEVNNQYVEKSEKEKVEAKALYDYIYNFLKLENKYFEYKAISGWEETANKYINKIKEYDRIHKDQTIKEKLENYEYKEAYDWLAVNTRISKNKEVWGKLEEYEKKVYEFESLNNTLNSVIHTAVVKSDAADKYGIIDARKLTDEQLAIIKKHMMTRLRMYDNEANIFGDVPETPIFTREFYDIINSNTTKIADMSEKDKLDGAHTRLLERKRTLVGIVNKYLEVGRKDNPNHIDTVELIKNLTKEELEELKNALKELKDIKTSKRTKDEWRKFFNNIEFKTNDVVYGIEKQKAKGSLTREEMVIWSDIFCEYDETGNLVPNSQIYGYMVPKDDKYIDKDKTEARKFIEDNIEQVPNKYYYEALNEAIAKDYKEPGYYKKWFEANHVYNRYSRKFEPLRVWCNRSIKPNSELLYDENGQKLDEYLYEPNFENRTRYVKNEYKNAPNGIEFDYKHNNFRDFDGNKYSTNLHRSKADEKLYRLGRKTMETYAKSKSAQYFVERGFLPRMYSAPVNGKYLIQQGLGTLGADIPEDRNKTWNSLEYVNEEPIETDMFKFLHAKGYKELKKYPKREDHATEKEYMEKYNEVKKENEEIEANNRKLEQSIISHDWKAVFEKLIETGEEAAARENIKHSLYLLLEDLKTSVEDGGAYYYKINKLTGKVIKTDNGAGVEGKTPVKAQMENTTKLLETFMHRLIYKEFKRPSKLNTPAAILQNITSAKYMIFNLTGGFANVRTGKANIFNEIFANEYLGYGDYNKARKEYFFHDDFSKAEREMMPNVCSFIADYFSGSRKSSNKTLALIKLLNVVNYDDIFERKESEDIKKYVSRVRDILYSLQSMGEHYMQNTVAIAMAHSNRIYKDNKGRWTFGSFADYTWQLEQIALENVLDRIDETNKGKNKLRDAYDSYLLEVKNNIDEVVDFDKFKKDFNAEFIRKYAGDKVAEIAEMYSKEKDKLKDLARKDFAEFTTVYDAIDFKDGECVLKDGTNFSDLMFGQFRTKCKKVNDKIHGVYDKLGAARIEQYWLGTLIMQYHKHLYPGILKRWRINGYYNEIRGSIEKGSYISLADFIATEFKYIPNNIKEKTTKDNKNAVIASIQEVFNAIIRTVTNMKTNWRLLPDWEKANMKRIVGDLYGMVTAMFMAIALYSLFDDDEIKDSELLSIALYCADRCYSEAGLYTPYGLKSEAKTQWSSPVAAASGPNDLVDIITVLYNILMDGEYNPTYTTGQYKGQNKAVVRLYRNIPGYRIYNRLSTMSKNNSYYKLGQTGVTNRAKKIVKAIKKDKDNKNSYIE